MAQANSIKALIEDTLPEHEVEIITIKTSGDKGNRDALGAFVKEIQEALLDERIDIAQHCLKDIPTRGVPGLTFAAHLEREDVRDTIITKVENWRSLPAGSVVGTGSLRRTAQLSALIDGCKFKPLIGNVDTRLKKLMNGDYDAIVLAIAGLKRLGVMSSWNKSEYRELIVKPMSVTDIMPAAGQAAIVLETRENDEELNFLLRPLNHVTSEQCVTAERAFLHRFGSGCSMPVGAHATCTDGTLALQGVVASPDGKKIYRGSREGEPSNADNIGSSLAEELGAQGAFDLLSRIPTRSAEAVR